MLTQDRQHVGEVLLALRVVGPDLLERDAQRGRLEREQPGVDLANVELELARVARRLGLDHPLDRPVGRSDDAAVAARVVEHDRRDRAGRTGAGVVLDEAVKRRGSDQRHVAVDHDHGFRARDRWDRGPDRVRCSQRPLLHRQLNVLCPVERRLEPPLGRVDDDDLRGARRARSRHGPLDDRPPAQRVQKLLGRRAHPSSLPGSKDHDDGRGHGVIVSDLDRTLCVTQATSAPSSASGGLLSFVSASLLIPANPLADGPVRHSVFATDRQEAHCLDILHQLFVSRSDHFARLGLWSSRPLAVRPADL